MGHFQPDTGRRRLTVPRDGFLRHSGVLQKTCLELLWAGSVANFHGVPKTVLFSESHETYEKVTLDANPLRL